MAINRILRYLRRLCIYTCTGRSKAYCAVLFCIVLGNHIQSNGQTKDTNSLIYKATHPSWITEAEDKKHRWLGVPIGYFTPETNLAFGAALNYIFHTNDSLDLVRPSQISLTFTYTLNRQVLFYLPFNVFLDKNKYWLRGQVAFYRYPYFIRGIGNNPADYTENYDASFPRVRLNPLYQVQENLYIGPSFWYQKTDVISVASGGFLETVQPTGFDGSTISGLGGEAVYDLRDNIFSPQKGLFIEVSYRNFFKGIGSTSDFQTYSIDFRKYYSLGKNHVFAAQLFSIHHTGAVPFNQLAQLGGDKIMRGFPKGYYRDQVYGAVQLEYRTPFVFRCGAAAFVSTGKVGQNINDLLPTQLHTAGGLGFRYLISKKERLSLRLDAAYGNDFQFYLKLSEAF